MRRLVVAGLGGVVVALAGCGGGGGGDGGRDDLAADTARFTWGERTATVELAECGREGDVVVMAGTTGDLIVQVAADLGEDGLDRTGVTGDMGGDGVWGAFGGEVGPGGAAGELTRVDVEGDRLTVEGRWALLDDDLRPDPLQPTVAGELVARCPGAAADGSA